MKAMYPPLVEDEFKTENGRWDRNKLRRLFSAYKRQELHELELNRTVRECGGSMSDSERDWLGRTRTSFALAIRIGNMLVLQPDYNLDRDILQDLRNLSYSSQDTAPGAPSSHPVDSTFGASSQNGTDDDLPPSANFAIGSTSIGSTNNDAEIRTSVASEPPLVGRVAGQVRNRDVSTVREAMEQYMDLNVRRTLSDFTLRLRKVGINL